MLRALRHRNFRLFFLGQGISLIGTWMQSVAMPWLVYRLTSDVLLLGVVGFTGQILTFVIAPLAGVLADRWDRRRLIIAAQALAMLQALAFAALTLLGIIQVWHIIALSFLTGFARGFEVPTRQSFVIQMLDDPGDLPNAIALNSFLVNGARLVGPSLAGILMAWVNTVHPAGDAAITGEGVVFLLNGVSYVAVLWAFFAMRIAPRRRRAPTTNLLDGLKEGFLYAMRHPPIRSVLMLLGVASLVAVPYTTLMPVFAKNILHGDSQTMGFLMGAVGTGAIVGALFLASRRSVIGFRRTIVLAAGAFGAGLVAFALSRDLWLSLPLLVWVGAAMMLQTAASNTLLQTLTDEDKRGRVMSFYTMMFMGMAPFGSLLAGWVADNLGAPMAVGLGGAACVLGALAFGTRLAGLGERAAPARPGGLTGPPGNGGP